MHRLNDCALRLADFLRRGRFAAAALAVVAALVLPAVAQADQTLTVEKVGSGAGAVTSSPAGLECGETCSAGFADASTVILKGAPALHSQAVLWSGCDKVTFKDECQVTMSAARTVIARFDIQPEWAEYTITVQRTGTGQGTVTSSPAGIDCGEDCSETYRHYTQLTLSAEPAPGSVFDHWSGGGCQGQTGPCTTSVTGPRLIKATFTAVGNRTLSVSKAGSGQGTVRSTNLAAIDCGSTCSAELDAKTKVTLKATPAPGSTFAGWAGGGCMGTGACKVTMNEARSLTATFTNPAGSNELLVAGRAKVKAGRAFLKLACEGASPCQGSLKLLVKIRNAQGKAKGLVIAQGSFSLTAGQRQTIAVKLSSRAKRLLGGAQSLRARVTGTGIDTHAIRLSA